MNVTGQWRNTTFRLTVFFGVFFAASVTALLTFIYWKTEVYLNRQVENVISSMAQMYTNLSRAELMEQIEYSIVYDARHIHLIGLFGKNGEPVAGNLRYFPPEMKSDGHRYRFSYDASLRHVLLGANSQNAPAFVLPPLNSDRIKNLNEEQISGVAVAQATVLPSGEVLVLGRDITQLVEVQRVILNALVVGGSGILFLGFIGGLALTVYPLRRINNIREFTQKIMLGDFRLRIPKTGKNDELEMLTVALNQMLDEVARLLGEVKSVTDTIAHDLRTPLTRLRAMLYRLSQESQLSAQHRESVEQAVSETDVLLRRFRALLRIAEIENRERQAGFVAVDLSSIVLQIFDLFEPLAEEKSIRLQTHIQPTSLVMADPDLLFEALSNLVDNAIKFTPAEGNVDVRLSVTEAGPQIDIADSGPGVAASERETVLQRFYRSDRTSDVAGSGLGLSIASAILLLHGFRMEFQDVSQGTHLTIYCWPHLL